MNAVELQKWREAHPGINIADHLIEPVGNFPSLYANDLADKISVPHPDLSAFVRAMFKECSWSYGNWAKAQHDADESKLLRALYGAAGGIGGDSDPHGQYSFVRRFLVDYALANNLPNPSAVSRPQDDWSERLGLSPLGTVYTSSPAGSSVSEDPAARAVGGGAPTVVEFVPDSKAAAA